MGFARIAPANNGERDAPDCRAPGDADDADRPLALRCACGAQTMRPGGPRADAPIDANAKLEASLVEGAVPAATRCAAVSCARSAPARRRPPSPSVLPLGALQAMAQDKAPLEKKDLKIGFIPITCATPLIMAHPLGFYRSRASTSKSSRPRAGR